MIIIIIIIIIIIKHSSSLNKMFVNASKEILKNRNGTFPVVRYFI